MLSVLVLVLDMALGIALTAWVIRWDTRRLPPERYARSWNVASFWSAVVGFQLFAIPLHFARTRRSLVGFLLGCLWALGVFTALWLAESALAWLLGGE